MARSAGGKRIVHVITRFIRGGADENTMLTCNGQAALGHEVHLFAGTIHPGMAAALDPRVVLHHLTSLKRDPSLSDIACLAQLFGIFRRMKPDIVHTHESKAGILGRLAASAARVPLVIHGVHILPFLGVSRPVAAVYLTLERIAARATDGFISVSNEMREVCLAKGLGDEASHFVVASGMDLAVYREAKPLSAPALADSGVVAPDPPLALIAGTLEPRKRVGDLVAGLARKGRDARWTLLVVGDGAQRDAVAAMIERLDLKDRVFLLGYRKDLPRLLATADFLVHAAGNEGLPRVLVQAVLAGRPVVSTALPGVGRIVGEGVNGLLAPVDDPDALVDAFLAMAADPALRERCAAASREIDMSPWDRDTMVSQIDWVYEHLAVRGAGSSASTMAMASRRGASGS